MTDGKSETKSSNQMWGGRFASGPDAIIHAYDRHAVAENALPVAWRRRIAYAFQFPDVTD